MFASRIAAIWEGAIALHTVVITVVTALGIGACGRLALLGDLVR